MIKFFRNIRRSLLNDGKTGKYLKYAIGEIILVVIGILIALQINNWNEQRKANKLLRTYEANIINELEEDLIAINKADSIIDVRIKSIENYMDYYASESKNIDELVNKRDSTQLKFVLFQKNTFSLQDLITSGNLQLFSMNKKRSILKYKMALDEFDYVQSLGMELAKDKYNEMEKDIDKIDLMIDSRKEQASNSWRTHNFNSHQLRKLNNYIMTFLEHFQGQKAYLNRLKYKSEELKNILENK